MKQYGWFIGVFVLLSSQAMAEGQTAASGAAGSGALAQGLLLVAFGLIFYFLFIRPQNKRAKEHQQLITGLQKGDEVITTGGLLGKIARVGDNFFVLMIAEGVEVLVQRQAITASVPRDTMKKTQ